MAGGPSPSVRYFTPDQPALPRTLRGKLEARRVELIGLLADGGALDFADYKLRIGTIRGLDEATNICREAEKDMES